MIPDPDANVDGETPAQAEPEAGPGADEVPDDQEIDFVTLGMFIIDEIEFPPPKPPARDVLGGAGTYSALGARLFSPPPLSRTVGWIVDQGSDFPPPLTDLINSWQTSAVFRHDPSRLTTRGWNGYGGDSQHRAFRYTTPKKRLTPADLPPSLLRAKAVHLICSPTRCQELIASLLALRKQQNSKKKTKKRANSNSNSSSITNLNPNPGEEGGEEDDNDAGEEEPGRPLIVWEPVPDRCTPDELLNTTNTLPLVDVCSPNHAELAALMGESPPNEGDGGEGVDRAAVERACEQLLASMPLQSYTLVVRAGRAGCFIARNGGRKKKVLSSSSGDGGAGKTKKRTKKKKEYVRGGLRPDTDMEALFAGLLQDEEGHVAREEIELDPGVERWLGAYYTHHSDGGGDDGVEGGEVKEEERGGEDGADGGGTGKVVDPTGGGNTFLGALAVALARGKSIEEACAWGNVAASFAIEQVGFPVLGVDEEGRETWNEVKVEDRLREYREREGL